MDLNNSKDELKRLELEELQLEEQLLKREQMSNVSAGDSFDKGFYSNLAAGFDDEIAGAAESVGSLVGVRGLGQSDWDKIRFENDEEKQQSMGDVYDNASNQRREVVDLAKGANPVAFGSGAVTGSLATAFGTGGGSLVAKSSGLGAVSGFGHSEGDLMERSEDAAIGAAIGLGTGATAILFGKVVSGFGDMAKKAGLGLLGRKAQERVGQEAAEKMGQDLRLADAELRNVAKTLQNEINVFKDGLKLNQDLASQAAKQVKAVDLNSDGIIGFGANVLRKGPVKAISSLPTAQALKLLPKGVPAMAPNFYATEAQDGN